MYNWSKGNEQNSNNISFLKVRFTEVVKMGACVAHHFWFNAQQAVIFGNVNLSLSRKDIVAFYEYCHYVLASSFINPSFAVK